MCLVGDGMFKPRSLTTVVDLPNPKPGTSFYPSVYRLVIIASHHGLLWDRTGRKVAEIHPSPNRLSRISAGVTFLKPRLSRCAEAYCSPNRRRINFFF